MILAAASSHITGGDMLVFGIAIVAGLVIGRLTKKGDGG